MEQRIINGTKRDKNQRRTCDIKMKSESSSAPRTNEPTLNNFILYMFSKSNHVAVIFWQKPHKIFFITARKYCNPSCTMLSLCLCVIIMLSLLNGCTMLLMTFLFEL